MYVDQNLSFKVLKDYNSHDSNILESLSKFAQAMGKFLLLALSIAPSSENLLTFLGISYITGDFNLDLLQSQNNSVTAEFVENLFPFSFFALNKKKLTRTTQYSAILIDDIFTNNTLITVKNGLTVTDISDHFPIYSIFQTNASDL